MLGDQYRCQLCLRICLDVSGDSVFNPALDPYSENTKRYCRYIDNFSVSYSGCQNDLIDFINFLNREDEHKLHITFTIYYSEILLIVILSYILSFSSPSSQR